MPEELWTEAVGLALEYGVHPVSKNVEISYTRLKKMVDEKKISKASPRQSETSFVQISPMKTMSSPLTRVEISRPDGCRLSVENVSVQMASEVTAVFLGMRQ